MGQRANPATLWLGLLLLALPAAMGAATVAETGQIGTYAIAGATLGASALALLVLAAALAVATAGTLAAVKLSS